MNSTRATIRRHVKQMGAERYRILKSGEVNYYGRIPNTNEIGWYFMGWAAAEVAATILAEDDLIADGIAVRNA